MCVRENMACVVVVILTVELKLVRFISAAVVAYCATCVGRGARRSIEVTRR